MTEYGAKRPAISRPSPSDRWKSAGVTLALPIFMVIVYAHDPARSILYPPCPFHTLTGFYCPGCGTLRALHQLLHAHLLQAIRLNLVTILTLPFLGYAYLSHVLYAVSGRRLSGFFVPAVYIWMLVGIIISFWVLRNIPLFPFSLLAP
jgi:hypothetical protein